MRIHHHLTIILAVAIVGAAGLVITVGLLLGGLERAARESADASNQHADARAIADDAAALREHIDKLSAYPSPEGFAVMHRIIEDSIVRLVHLRQEPMVSDRAAADRAFDALQETGRLASNQSADVPDPVELDRLHAAALTYRTAAEELDRASAETARRGARLVARRRRMIMLTIGLICFMYLAVIERVRHWTMRQMVDPIRKMSDAARSLLGASVRPAPSESNGTEEVTTLKRMLGSFTDAIRENVRQRTEEVERQKESLEQEVRVRRKAVQDLRYAAHHDILTGLCNRDLLLDRLRQSILRSTRVTGYDFAVLLAAVDQHKEIGDRLGHLVGDQLLVAVAERFRKCLDEKADGAGIALFTLARLGGDEFAVLLDGIDARAQAETVAGKLQSSLVPPLTDRRLRATTSIGITFREGEETAEDLLRNADAAMCYAKAAGVGTQCVFDRSMHDQSTARRESASRLRQALADGEFNLTYQPIISLATRKMTGFEALARWNHPTLGSISPVEFIPEAEETGVIVEIGRWVMANACRQLHAWRRHLPRSRELTVSVNVSKLQLCEAGLVDQVRDILRDTELDGGSLKLEITESVIVECSDQVLDVLRRLKDLGVEIHMDDFGTGYSSLSYLHRLPIDVLKIDRAFMSTLSDGEDCADVVPTVVALARSLDLRVTVEGVTSEDQVARVTALDCDFAQGFYFSKPLSAESATGLIASDPRWDFTQDRRAG